MEESDLAFEPLILVLRLDGVRSLGVIFHGIRMEIFFLLLSVGLHTKFVSGGNIRFIFLNRVPFSVSSFMAGGVEWVLMDEAREFVRLLSDSSVELYESGKDLLVTLPFVGICAEVEQIPKHLATLTDHGSNSFL